MKHLKRVIALLLLALLLISPAEAVGIGHVNASSGLRLRKEASTSAEVYEIVPNGAEVTALKLSNGWYTVRYQNTVGYMDAEYVDVLQTASYASPLTGRILGDVVNPLAQPNAEADVMAQLAGGSQVTVVGVQSSWYVIQFGSMSGYLHPANVELTNATQISPVTVTAPATGGPDIIIAPSADVIEAAVPTQTANETEPQPAPEEPAAEPEAEPAAEPAALLTAEQPEEPAANDDAVYAFVTGSVVNVRAEATTSSDVLTKLSQGTRVEILEDLGEWCRIAFGDSTGYMASEYLMETNSLSDASSLRQEIVQYASQYLGIMYRYGGKNPSTGFDCSGFVYYVFSHFGYTLNPGASNQMRNSTRISKEELLPGDLVFFNNGSAALASHVAIYIGDGKIIHATRTGRPVSINSLSESYYSRYYAGAGRVIFD